MSMRWVLIEKWVKLVRLGVSQKIGKMCKGGVLFEIE